jgi:hypothetical protein
MEVIAVAAAVVGAVGSYQSGVAQRSQYNLQAKQASVEGERRAIQYQQRSNDILRRVQANNSTLAARAYAGGIDPFSGSPSIVRAANETAAGREYGRLLADADSAMRGGVLQAQLYEQAGQTAYQQGIFNAITKLGMAAGQASGSSSGKQSPAPVESREAGLPRFGQ